MVSRSSSSVRPARISSNEEDFSVFSSSGASSFASPSPFTSSTFTKSSLSPVSERFFFDSDNDTDDVDMDMAVAVALLSEVVVVWCCSLVLVDDDD